MTADDAGWVLALNAADVSALSPLDAPRLTALREGAFAALAVDPEAAFLIAFDQDAAYDSPNFLWFRARFARFVYVDRIVVGADHRRKGLAGALYAALFARARAAGHDAVVCEVNAEPPNPASDAFHTRLGFAEIGQGVLAEGKVVRYYRADL